MLELLIVLAIMVGMAALSFPRLSRPLTESDAQRAANQLRDELADCRQTAMLSGQPMFLRLEAGSAVVQWGGWSSLMAGEIEGSDAYGGSVGWQPEPAANSAEQGMNAAEQGGTFAIGSGSSLRSFTLPPGMIIESVHWQPMLASSGAFDPSGSPDDPSLPPSSEPLSDEPSVNRSDEAFSSSLDESAESQPSSGTRWYLPMLPSGRTRSGVIAVLDTDTGSRSGIEIDAVTGMVRLIRLAAATDSVEGAIE